MKKLISKGLVVLSLALVCGTLTACTYSDAQARKYQTDYYVRESGGVSYNANFRSGLSQSSSDIYRRP